MTKSMSPDRTPPPVGRGGNPLPGQSTPPIAVVDIGASAVRLLVAEVGSKDTPVILDSASKGILLGKDTFTNGSLGAATIEATLKALVGFKKIMDGYGVVRYRAVATSAVREAGNRDTFIDRVKLKTGLEVEIIDGSEENRLTYLAVREALSGREALESGDTLLVEVGGGSADISFLRAGQPVYSGTYPLGSIRMRQGYLSAPGTHETRARLLRRHIHNVVEDIRRELPLGEARHCVLLGGDVRFAAEEILGAGGDDGPLRVLGREEFITFCDQLSPLDSDELSERYRLTPAEAETLAAALLAYREIVAETQASRIKVLDATLRQGLLIDLARGNDAGRFEDFTTQVIASASALGERYRYDEPHARNVATLAVQLFDELITEHGLGPRERVLLRVAALLHDVGTFVSLRAHHKHSHYILSVSEIFGLTRDDMQVIANVARYHRRTVPQRSHLPFITLDSGQRVVVSKLGALLRVANALDADHLQKVLTVRVDRSDERWALEVDGAGDLTLERLASLARADLLTEVFGHRVYFREAQRP
jgi:exopolyphosphatase/guanosine-5'-triphosphate,3'-diphosphate pyrophosphatase